MRSSVSLAAALVACTTLGVGACGNDGEGTRATWLPDAGSEDGASQDGSSRDDASQDGSSRDGASQDGSVAVPAGEPVRLWDLGKAYGTGLNMNFAGWADRDQWTQVPYGSTPAAIEHDVALEGPTFYFNITWRSDGYIAGPVLYHKPPAGDPDRPRHNLLYRGWYTPWGLWAGGPNLGSIKVLANAEDEVLVESVAALVNRGDGDVRVTANYGVKRGKPWLEITPVNQCDIVGMHGESRFAVSPEAQSDGSDYIYDSMPPREVPPGQFFVPGKMLLDFVMDDDNLWVMMPTPADTNVDPTSALPADYIKNRFFLSLQINGYHAGWMKMGEDSCDPASLATCTCVEADVTKCSQDVATCCFAVISAPYATFLGRKVAIAHFRIGYWHYQKIDAAVTAGSSYAIKWNYAYQGTVKDSPFKTGQPWYPMYPGVWRMITRIDGTYRTTTLDIKTADVGKTDATIPIPASGKLEYVLLYLYERNSDTPKDFYTVMDAYRDAILNVTTP